jgi:hypothetical protein
MASGERFGLPIDLPTQGLLLSSVSFDPTDRVSDTP